MKAIWLILIPAFLLIIWFTVFTKNEGPKAGEAPGTLIASAGNISPFDLTGNESDFNSAKKIEFPILFPLEKSSREMLLDLKESRLPGAARSYRGANAKHKGIDLYSGECGLEVYSPAGGWIIDLNDQESFTDASTRNAILNVANESGFTPDPILRNLHGIYLVIFHGWDDDGKAYYSRLSHLEKLSLNYKVGDHVARGDLLGYVGTTGTSSQFKSEQDRIFGCHLHFEWHFLAGGEDQILGFEERDDDLKRQSYYNLFAAND